MSNENRNKFYDAINAKEVEEIHQRNYQIQKELKEGHTNPLSGKIIKAGTYTYQPYQEPELQEQSYEDKVNSILETYNIENNTQTKTDDMVQAHLAFERIRAQNSIQNRVNTMIRDDEER